MKNFFSEMKILFIPCSENDFRPYFIKSKFLLYYIVVLVVLNILAAGLWISLPKTIFFADVTKSTLFILANQEREELGLSPLKESAKLNEVAYQKAKDMMENDYFAHYSPTGITPWHWFQNVGYSYQAAGENLAIGFIDSGEVMDAWIDSPSHRDNLFSPNFKETGIAVLTGEFNGQEITLVVQSFGSPSGTVSPAIDNGQAENPVPPTAEEISEEKITIEERGARVEPVVAAAAHFVTVDYFSLSQKILFYSIILIALAVVLNIFIHIKTQDKSLILRSFVFLIILAGLIILMGKDTVLQIIPHDFQI